MLAGTMPAYLAGGGGGGGRNLSLRQTRELIDDVYMSKGRHDRKAAEARLPRETLAQHLATYLNNRYGLRLLIAEYSQACYDAIRDYEETDAEVATFGCILRNEVEEGFVVVQRQLRHTVSELLRLHIRSKLAHKPEAHVAETHKRKTEGVITEEEWSSITSYMYTATDAEALGLRLTEQARRAALLATHPSPSTPGVSRTASRGRSRGEAYAAAQASRIPYHAFVQVLLDFQLSGHLQYLAPFVMLFRELDLKQRGVLDEPGFRQLVARLESDRTEGDLTCMLEAVDPHNHQRITFSDCVCALADDYEHFRQHGGGMEALQACVTEARRSLG